GLGWGSGVGSDDEMSEVDSGYIWSGDGSGDLGSGIDSGAICSGFGGFCGEGCFVGEVGLVTGISG
ncbi:hypothetical protein L195_g064571, partial [Trifolium pratense]